MQVRHIQKWYVYEKSINEQTDAREVKKYQEKKDMTSKETHSNIVLAEDSLFYAAVKNWATEFKRNRDNIENEFRSNRLLTSTTDEQVDAIHCLILDKRHFTVNQIAKSTDICSGSVYTILTALAMSKLSPRWVSRILTLEHKLTWVDISCTFLTHF